MVLVPQKECLLQVGLREGGFPLWDDPWALKESGNV